MGVSTVVGQLLTGLTLLSFYEAAGLVIAAAFVHFLLLSTYRLTFHPLAKYPGSFVHKISSWPLVYDCYSGNRHLRLLELHKKYGPVVRIAPNTLDFDTLSALNDIHKDRNANLQKSDWYKTVDASSGAFSVQTVIDKKEHSFRRRVLASAFSDNSLRNQEQFIVNSVDAFLRQIGRNVQDDGWTEALDFNVWITYFGFDFISDLAFGSSFNLLESTDFRYMPDLLKLTSHFVYYAGYLPFAPLLNFIMGTPIMNYIPSQAGRETHKYFIEGERKLGERQAADEEAQAAGGEVRRDIFHYLLRGRDPETGLGFTHEQLKADAGLLIAAGSDGVAVTVSAALFYLLRNPGSLKRLVREVRSAFATADEVRGYKLQQLPYLGAVIDEALRLAPSVLSAFPRTVMAGGIVIDGRRIPEGTTVGVSAYVVHHNEEYFPDSFAWRPERWLGEEGKKALTASRSALCTFSFGRYNCIGKNVALLASKLVLAKMIYVYDVIPAGNTVSGGGGKGLGNGREREDEYQLQDYLVAYRSGPMVQFKLAH